jgi:hypothetical protein
MGSLAGPWRPWSSSGARRRLRTALTRPPYHRGIDGRLRALEQLASPNELEGAEAATALEEYREWSAAGRPGAISHEQARKLLLG